MLALTQKGFGASDVLAMSKAEATALIYILTDDLPAARGQKRIVSRRKRKPK